MTDVSDSAIQIEGLSLAFDGRPLFDRFSLDVARSESVIITGPSGCGKSSLLRCLLGFHTPPGGRISILGDELTAHSIWRVRQRMAYVPQEPSLGRGTVIDLLRQPLAYHANRHLQVSLTDVEELSTQVGLPPILLTKDISALSGGEKQRVAIVSALLLKRRIIILDEPTSALDARSAQRLADTLDQLADTALLAVCHDPTDLPVSATVVDLGTGGGSG